MRSRGRWAAGLALAAGLLLAAPAAADVQRVEEVGAVPLRGRSGGGGAARDAAVQAGLKAAVERVARSFLMEAEAPSGAEPDDSKLAEVLGTRMVPYTTRFRVLEDRGEQPSPGPGTRKEYVVLVEVYVDADRVQQRLVDAGLLARDPLSAQLARVRIELRGVQSYAAVAAVRRLLTDEIRASSVVPVHFERGVAVLQVAVSKRNADPAELADRLASLAPPELELRPREIDADGVVIDVTWRGDAAGKGAARR